jgi:pimeloyl-ACP methyl ester carboxylesterase
VIDRSLQLPDGRTVSYLDLGDPSGTPVFHFHGSPSSRLETLFFDCDAAATRAGVRLLALDRPGIGGSDPRRGRTLLDQADDVASAAGALGIERYGLLGYSVGAASALACRAGRPERVTATAIVSGIGPADVDGLAAGRSPDVSRFFRAADRLPWLARIGLRFMRYGTTRPERMIAATGRGMPPADRAVAERPGAAAPFAAFLAEALRQGTSGVLDDTRLVVRPWGFAPGPTVSPLTIWHGTADTNVPVAAALWLAGLVPQAQLHLIPDEGHVSLLDARAEEVHLQLAAAAAAA